MSVKRRGIYYQTSPCYPCDDWFAHAYAESVCPERAALLKALNPAHIAYDYKSATDSYTLKADGSLHPEGQQLAGICAGLGIAEETQYLHWDDDTIINWWEGPQFYPAGSRVEVYRAGHQGGGQTRHAHSFLVPAPIIEFWKQRTTLDGLFLDNCANILYNWGMSLASGGRVREAQQIVGTPAFNSWHWQHLRDALVQFKPLSAINIANSWTDEYLSYSVADRLVQEFVGNPIRDTWPSIAVTRARHALAAAKGVGIWTSSAASESYCGTPPVTYQELQHFSLCLFLCVASETSSFHLQDLTGAYRPDWPQRLTPPALYEVERKLGVPTGEPELLPGTHIYRRTYGKPGGGGGAVYARILEPWNGRTDQIESFPRPPQMLVLQPDGTWDKPDSVQVKNGGGVILIRP